MFYFTKDAWEEKEKNFIDGMMMRFNIFFTDAFTHFIFFKWKSDLLTLQNHLTGAKADIAKNAFNIASDISQATATPEGVALGVFFSRIAELTEAIGNLKKIKRELAFLEKSYLYVRFIDTISNVLHHEVRGVSFLFNMDSTRGVKELWDSCFKDFFTRIAHGLYLRHIFLIQTSQSSNKGVDVWPDFFDMAIKLSLPDVPVTFSGEEVFFQAAVPLASGATGSKAYYKVPYCKAADGPVPKMAGIRHKKVRSEFSKGAERLKYRIRVAFYGKPSIKYEKGGYYVCKPSSSIYIRGAPWVYPPVVSGVIGNSSIFNFWRRNHQHYATMAEALFAISGFREKVGYSEGDYDDLAAFINARFALASHRYQQLINWAGVETSRSTYTGVLNDLTASAAAAGLPSQLTTDDETSNIQPAAGSSGNLNTSCTERVEAANDDLVAGVDERRVSPT